MSGTEMSGSGVDAAIRGLLEALRAEGVSPVDAGTPGMAELTPDQRLLLAALSRMTPDPVPASGSAPEPGPGTSPTGPDAGTISGPEAPDRVATPCAEEAAPETTDQAAPAGPSEPAEDPPAPEPVPTPEPVQIPPQAPPEVPTGPGFPPTAVRASVLAAALLGCLVAAAPVAAQTQPTDPCQAQPDGQGGSDDDEADGGADRANDDRRAGLERCNGVLTPPRIGDHEIEEPAPDTGTTPVIPPERVPEQLRR